METNQYSSKCILKDWKTPLDLLMRRKKTLRHSVFEGCVLVTYSMCQLTVVAKNGGMWLEHDLGNKL